MSAIFKMNLRGGRQGDLQGIFIADKQEVDNLITSKKEIYFGEVLGKHSEVVAYLTHDEIKMVSDNPSVVGLFQELNMQCGYNPFSYIEEDGE